MRELRKTRPPNFSMLSTVVRTADFLTCFDIGRVDLSLKFPSPGVLQREYSDRHSLPEDFTAVKDEGHLKEWRLRDTTKPRQTSQLFTVCLSGPLNFGPFTNYIVYSLGAHSTSEKCPLLTFEITYNPPSLPASL